MKFKQVFAILLCLSMFVSAGNPIFAADSTEHDESFSTLVNDIWENCSRCDQNHPHLISTLEELDHIREHIVEINGTKYINGYFKLTNDLIFDDSDFEEGGTYYNDGWGWTPIGHNNVTSYFTGYKFIGNFDGDNHTIENLKITRPANYWYNGLFAGLASGSEVKNLKLRGFVINADNAGALCGQIYSLNDFKPAHVYNISIDDCEIMNIQTAAKPSGILAGCISGNLHNILIENSSLISNHAWKGSFIASEASDCEVSNVIVKNCLLRPYAYFGMLASFAGINTHYKNIVIEESTIEPTHAAFQYLVYDGSAKANQPAIFENIYIDVDVAGSLGNKSHSLFPYPNENLDQEGYKLRNSIIKIKFSTEANELERLVNVSADALPQGSIKNVYVESVVDNNAIHQSCYLNDNSSDLELTAFYDKELKIGDSYTLLDSVPEGLQLLTDNTNVVQIEGGRVKALKPGEAVISAVMTIDGNNIQLAQAKFIVEKLPIEITLPQKLVYSLTDELQAPYLNDIEGVTVSPNNSDIQSAFCYRWLDDGVMTTHPYLPFSSGQYEVELFFAEDADYVIDNNDNKVIRFTAECNNGAQLTAFNENPLIASVYIADGTAKGYFDASTLKIQNGNFEQLRVHYYGLNNTNYSEHISLLLSAVDNETLKQAAPVQPGEYILIINGKSDDEYYVHWEKKFAIIEKQNDSIVSSNNISYTPSADGSGKWQILKNGKIRFKENQSKNYAKGLLMIDGINYYFDDAAYLISNQFFEYENNLYYAAENGQLANSWKMIANDWYFFEKDGRAANRWVAHYNDWYKIENGMMLCNQWIATSMGRWYYVGHNGAMVRNQSVDGCYLNAEGIYLSPLYYK